MANGGVPTIPRLSASTRLLIVGPPGVGKGTQARLLATELDIPAISTGELFRDHVRRRSAIGLQIEAILSSGDYVPDDVTNALVRDRLSEPDAARGFILDGYPRTPAQVAQLDDVLAASGDRVDAVVQLCADEAELLARLRQRENEEGRGDDAPEIIRHRIDVYEALTAPLLDIYKARGILLPIDGLRSIPHVSQAILHSLATGQTG